MKRYILIFIFINVLIINSFAQVDLNHQTGLLDDSSKNIIINLESDIEFNRLQYLKSNLNNSEKKLSTDLLQLLKSEFLPEATSIENHSKTMITLKQFKPFEQANNFDDRISEGVVYVYVYLNPGNSTSIVNSFSEEITDRDEKNNLAVAWVKVKNLESLASMDAVRIIRTVMPPIRRTGSVNTEGDAVHRTSNVRTTYGENGTGVKVGIISDGVDTRATAQASGDLPLDGLGLTVLSNTYGGDEGTAMLEIVHDMVPGAELFFHDLGGNTVAFNSAIDDLITAGCDIICDDIGWLLEPFYEDGIVASHINSVINANDIIYVSSAGNSGDSHYQGGYYPIPSSTQHDFSEGGTSGYYLYLPLSVGQQAIIILQWDDPYGGSGNDYDLYLYNLGTSTTVAFSENVQSGTQDPLEHIIYTRPVGGPTSYNYAIIVNQYSGSPVNLEVFIYAPTNYSNNIKAQDAIFGHPAVNSVVSVGAVRWNTPGTIEFFSSQGPSTIAYPVAESRQTPKVVGVNGVTITGAGGFPSPFYGTSASAPHIVAILAQAWSFDLSQTANEVKQLLYDWPVDLGSGGYDNVFGYGRGDALNIFDGALPVELSSFTAKVLKSGGVQLNWRTETEVSNYGFEIERSENPKSEIQNPQFEKISFVEGHGNSNSPKDYSFVDNSVYGGKYSYRLKQIDTDGKFEYSKVIEVDAGSIPGGFVLEQNYPNPFNPTTTIKFALAETQSAKLIIYDVLGNEVAVLFNGTAEAGKLYESEFNGENFSSGIYFYRLETESKVENRKMLLIK
ncbi:MAG: S8 family serine peptidase [Ignavibacteriaceae bacterium]|nr:S8 family serine peptidase [Ignavibacteriaceae bacterium]